LKVAAQAFGSSQTKFEFGITGVAPEDIMACSAAADWPQGCENSVVDPATGALQLTPAFRDKAAKALMREVRRMELRLQLTLALLHFRKLMLQCRSAASRVRRQYLGLLDYLGCVGHGIFPGKPKGSESKTASCPVKALRAGWRPRGLRLRPAGRRT
jgi:hypothetical protein